MVRPRAFAVLRLMTSSNFVGRSIGISDGLDPFRTRPAIRPMIRQISTRDGPYDIRQPFGGVFLEQGNRRKLLCGRKIGQLASMTRDAVLVRQEVLDHAILHAISDVLDARILDAAADKAMAELRAGHEHHVGRQAEIEKELTLISARMERALDALLNGGPKDELIARLNVEKTKKRSLTDELSKLGHLTAVVSIDAARLKRDLQARVADAKALLGRHTPQARQ